MLAKLKCLICSRSHVSVLRKSQQNYSRKDYFIIKPHDSDLNSAAAFERLFLQNKRSMQKIKPGIDSVFGKIIFNEIIKRTRNRLGTDKEMENEHNKKK